MSIIHNGFIDRKFHDSFKDTGLNDVDIATTKMYKGVKPMWKQLGFGGNSFDKPNTRYYWGNIIPSHYTFQNVEGITITTSSRDDFPEEGDGVGIVGGSRTPRTFYTEIIIEENENQSQDWHEIGGLSPYYPTLPRIDKYGIFTERVDEPFLFGSKTTWDDIDDSAPITNLVEEDENLILNIDFDQTTTDDLIDKTNLSKINYNQDYEMKLNKDLRVERSTQLIPDSITKDTSKQAF